MNLQKILIKDWPALFLLALPFILIAIYWNQIPNEIAMHWNTRGEIDRWGEKGFDVFFLPLVSVGVYLLLLAVPYIDPKRKAEGHQKGIRAFRIITPFLMTGIFIAVLMQWLGSGLDIGKALGLVMTVFFLVTGNYLQNVRPNYFIGIRTPWTLENDEIWRKTHRFGGKTWVIVSLLMLISWPFLSQSNLLNILIVGYLFMALAPVGYSFYLYAKNKQTARTDMDGID